MRLGRSPKGQEAADCGMHETEQKIAMHTTAPRAVRAAHLSRSRVASEYTRYASSFGQSPLVPVESVKHRSRLQVRGASS